MISDTLISDEVWAEAPEDPQEAFLYIALSANRKLQELGLNEQLRGQHDYSSWRKQYIYEISSVAEQLGIQEIPSAAPSVQGSASMADFDAKLARVITKIKASNRHNLRADSVTLSYQTKQDIRSHLEELRAKINASNLSDTVRDALHKKVDAVEVELNKTRSGLRSFWVLAGAISAAGCMGIGALADADGALETINKVVELAHQDRAAEVQNDHRLTQPTLRHENKLQITDQSQLRKPAS